MATVLTDIALDDDGDLLIENGDFVLITGQDAMKQRIKIALQMYLGEYKLDSSKGVAYLPVDGTAEFLFDKSLDQSTREAIVKDAILRITGVTAIIAFALDIDRSTRVATITTTVATNEGIIENVQVEV